MKKLLVAGLVLVCLSFSGCEMLQSIFGKVTVTFELNGGHIDGNTKAVEISGDAGEEFLLPQNPFKNASETIRYEFAGWSPKGYYTFDHESFIYDTEQVATFPEEDIVYVASYDFYID